MKKRGSGAYRYGFNGKEKDDEVKNKEGTQLDYGMRIYDTRLGRFLSTDPLQKQYAFYTPYQFAGNTPLQAVDLDGAEPDYIFAGSKIRDYENNLRKTDPAHAEEKIQEHKKTAFLTVGSMLTAGSSTLFSAFTDAIALYGGYKFSKGLVKKDANSVQEGTHLMAGAAVGDMGGAIFGKAFKALSSSFKVGLKEAFSQVKTSANEAFFWSGRTDGIGGADVALEIARSKGGTTLEGLIESKGIKIPEWDINNPESVKAWTNISVEYASQVSGKVGAVIGKELRKDAVWLEEVKVLKENKNVSEIYTIDPKTRKETTIFKR